MKKYVVVGGGNRAIEMFIKPIIERFSNDAVITAVLDINLKRAGFVKKYIPYDVKIYDDFDKMIKEVEADVCIIATMDCYHEFYIEKALSYNMMVICEKPVVINAEQYKDLLSLDKEKQNKIIITFNSRYMPINMKIKELLEKEKIGKILNVQYHYMLDKEHGAEYFRRWHRYREKSGFQLAIVGEHGQIMLDFNQTKQVNSIFVYRENGEIDKNDVESIFDKKHNGDDEQLQIELFKNRKLETIPKLRDGLCSVSVGIAALKSIEEERKITICEAIGVVV